MGTTATLARPEGARKTRAKKKVGRPRMPERDLAPQAIRMTREYADWLARLAAFDRRTIAGMIDQAVAMYARDIGFTEPPPPRL